MKNGQVELPQDLMNMLYDENWSNAACCGYAIIACKSLGYSEKEQTRFIKALEDAFRNYTVESAEKRYYTPL